MGATITAYTYVHSGAASHGLPHPPFSSTSTIGVIEQATSGTTTYVRPTVSCTFTDQLTAWQTTLDAETPAGYYSIAYDPASKRVTISSTVAFRLVLPEVVGVWSGFTQNLGTGYATSWTGASMPTAVCGLLGATVEPAENADRIDLHEYRHGRAAAVAWGNHAIHKVTLDFKAEDLRVLDPGYLVTGRVSIQQGSDATPYSPTNTDGVIDGYVIACSDPTEDGDLGELWSIALLVGVAR